MTATEHADAKRFLLVHEDEAVLATIRAGLPARLGSEVIFESATSYGQVLERLETQRFDLVIFHLNLPGEDPFSFVDALSVFAAGVPLIALSFHANEEAQWIVRELGCKGLVALPVDIDVLAATARRAMGAESDPVGGLAFHTLGPRILVVDDDELVRFTTKAMLRSIADVETCESPRKALTLLATESFDVLVVDLKMDEMDGVTFVRHARRLRPAAVALIATGFPDVGSAIAGFKEGVFDYLLKPLEPSLLRAAVGRAWGQYVLNRQRYRLFRELQTALQAIKSQTRELDVANHKLVEILDHMRQALLVFGADGVVDERRSRAARTLFGDDGTPTLKVSDLLFDDGREWTTKRQLFDLWLEIAFEAPEADWPEVSRSAPTEVMLGGPNDPRGKVWLELEFRPIFHDGKLSKILLIATDVSEHRRLQSEFAAEQTRYDAELAEMRRLVAGSGPAFAEFLHAGEARLAECRRALEETSATVDVVGKALRTVHTLRGEARAFSLDELAEECEKYESTLVAYQRKLSPPPAVAADDESVPMEVLRADSTARVSACEAALSAARELFVVASPSGRVALDQSTVRRSDLEWLERVVRGRGDEIEAAVRALSSRPFGECCAPIEGQANYWSEQEAKPLLLTIGGRDVAIPSALAQVLRGALPHLVRNCIAHGLETEAQRTACGKSGVGSIELSAQADTVEGAVVIRVSDDGRGVDEESVRARSLGTALEGTSVHELLFAPGLTTADKKGELAGLGVGLSAVRDDLRTIGYDVVATWTRGEGTVFTVAKARVSPSSPAG